LIAMPAITVDDTLVLPRITVPDPAASWPRPVAQVVTSHLQAEGAGFVVRRPFPGGLSMAAADPFLMLDHVGPAINGPNEAKGPPGTPTAASRR
jgi:quercetin 2,3-dioxygenase